MPDIVGAYKTARTLEGQEIPWYIIPFDKRGGCPAPKTRQSLLDALTGGDFTHVFMFSHGWNNDWSAARERYDTFVEGFAKLRRDARLAHPSPFRPLFIGLFWPGISLVLPWEKSPRFAAADGTPRREEPDAFADDFKRSVDAIADELSGDGSDQFRELADRDTLTEERAVRLAALLSPVLAADDELSAGAPEPSQLLQSWRASAVLLRPKQVASHSSNDQDDFGVSVPVAGASPRAAAGLGVLDPRHVVRMATVWMMKDRAGTVGAAGGNSLLVDILERSSASIHLVGHSYGCKLLMSAIARGGLSRPVSTALLLQPAFSRLAFARDVDNKGTPGGYRNALNDISQPIVTTFSSLDFPLARVFHLAVRRGSDLGERRFAGEAPSRFAALGGFGPGGMDPSETKTILLKEPQDPYGELTTPGLRVLALNGSRQITGHGAITQPAIYWALYEQLARCP